MTVQERIQKEMIESMKAHSELRLSVLRMMKTAIKLKETEKRAALEDGECLQVFSTMIKQRKESADQFRKGAREDLASKEEQEIAILDEYMPSAPSEEEITAAIDGAIAETGANSAKQMGLVMKAVQAKLAGKRVDGKTLSEKVKARLSSPGA